MGANGASGDRIHQALLHSLGLPTAELAASAFQVHALVSSVLSQQAGVILHGEKSNNTPASKTLLDGKKLRLAALAVFHKLSTLQNGIPITLSSLHDFIIVYTSTTSPASEDEARLARRTVESLFRKKPSHVRALENQLIPAWAEMMTSFADERHDDWMQEARAILQSVITMSKFATVREALQDSSASTDFWSALQALYDIGLPVSLAASASTGVSSISQLSNVKEYTSLRKEIVDFFASFFPALPAQTLTECLENEASNPDIPQILADLPLTSLINLTLLQDTEYYHGISRRVGLRKPAMSSMNNDERKYIQNALDISKTLSKENITDGLHAVSKGKGKASADADESASTSQQTNAMIAQVASVLPDTPVEDVRRLLTSAALEQVADEQKVERVISMLLEGDLPPEESLSKIEDSQAETRRTQEDSQAKTRRTQEDSSPPKQSAFASIRRNIFTDSLDISRIHRGKQDFKNDTFLPSELRASILAAAERQAQESDEDEEEEENAADDAFAGVDEDGEALATVKVQDDVSEESGLDEEEGDIASARQRPASSAQNVSATSSAPSLGQTGVPKDLERVYITTYTKDATVFSREARKAPARTDLKKKIAALRLPQSIADEQIEGWARMLERNPKKDKILERFNDQQFSGNEKGLDIRQGSSQGQNKQTRKVGEGDPSGGAPGGGRGGQGERGRGRGRGRARQSDQRRRGHDRKMQKAGL